MEIHYGTEIKRKIRNPIITTGSFDGIHFGHQCLIKYINRIAAHENGESVLVTFHPHPKKVLFPNQSLKLIQTLDEKIETLEATGLQHLVLIPFTKELAGISSINFLRKYIIDAIGIHTMVIGYDHKFGKDRQGGVEFLIELSKYYNFNVIQIDEQQVEFATVSSTLIRYEITKGDVEKANEYLGYDWFLYGTVEPGTRMGRRIGYRSANLYIADDCKILPATGVYDCSALIAGKTYQALAFIDNAAVNNKVRVHILNFSDEIYGQQIRIAFHRFIRNKFQFYSVTSLARQIQSDVEKVLLD
ncbi:MAG TPA: riboflavin biosynthesis protein RibF [Bacteroidales bacterium]|nr:riboflavin biosynthesis protein RibF [Bacteroidales bacterium]